MTLAETSFQRIDQALAHVGPRGQAIDQGEYIFEVLALVIIGRGEINLTAFVHQPREAALHEAHDVSSCHATGRRGDGATGSLPAFLVSRSPRIPVSVSLSLCQSRRRRKQDEESSA